MAQRRFEFDVHFDGAFMYQPLRHVGDVVLPIYISKLGCAELIDYLSLVCESPFNAAYFAMPGKELHDGLVRISTERDTDMLFDVGYCYGKTHIYLDHHLDDLSEYLIVAEDTNTVDIFHEEELVDNLDLQSQVVNGNENRDENDVDVDNENVDNFVTPVDRNKGRDVDVENEPSWSDSESDSEYELENESDSSESDTDAVSVDHLSEGEDELREFRLRKAQGKKQPKTAKQPKLGGVKHRGSTEDPLDIVTEHEEFMKELMDKLKGTTDDQDEDVFKKIENVEKWPIHDDKTNWRLKRPIVGERFINYNHFKEMLAYYGLANGFSIWYEKSTQKKIVAKCGQRPPILKNPEIGKQRKKNRYPANVRGEESKCPWRCYGKKMATEDSFQIISLKDEHTCTRNFRFGSLINYKWIGKHFGDRIRCNPGIRLVDIADMVMKKYKCIVSGNQCRMAKNWVLNEYQKSIEEHYGMLRSYADELLATNPGSTVKIAVTRDPDEKVYFDKMYICLGVIALDGCFLKKPNQGKILTAIGRDGNNHIYPIAWAIVSIENKENWTWFLELLSGDLELGEGSGVTLISDQHKGLIEAVKDVMPNSEHRQCARHIYEGFRKQFSGVYFQGLFWAASKSSNPVLFQKFMDKIKDANPLAHRYLVDKNPKTWSRAFFELNRGCESVENGFSECFNYVIVRVRNKPIITMLEAIRTIVLERMDTLRRLSASWNGEICPTILSRLEWSKDQQRYWKPFHCGLDEWEVRQGNEGFKVNEAKRSCSCRMWELTGLSCPHAVAVILKMAKNVEDYVPNWFRKSLYQETYSYHIHAVGGMTTWAPNELDKPLPPKLRKMPGRPKKKRRRAPHEDGYSVTGNITRVSKHGCIMTCQRCLQPGHNKKGCKNDRKEKPPKVHKKMGRPPKKGVGQHSRDVEDGGNVGQDGGNVGQDGGNVGQEGGNVGQEGGNVGQEGGNVSHDGGNAVPSRWTRRSLFDAKEKLSPTNHAGQQRNDNFVIGSCTATTQSGVALGVPSVGFRNPKLFGVKGPRRLPPWWGAGVCVDPKTGETFIAGGDGVPVPAWPPGVPLPSATEMAKQQEDEVRNTNVQPERRSPRLKGMSTPEKTKVDAEVSTPKAVHRTRRESLATQVRMRRPSERLLKRKLSKRFEGPGESSANALTL